MSSRGCLAIIVVVFATALAAGVAVAADRSSGPSASTSAVVTLRFASSAATEAIWKEQIANFEKEFPNVRVEASFLPGDYGAVLRTQIQAGNTPDVFFTSPGNGTNFSTLPFAKSGILMNLAGKPWERRIQPIAKPLLTIGKKLYGFPMDVPVTALFYNKPGLKALGVSAPSSKTSWAGLLRTCRIVAARGKVPFAVAGIPSSIVAGLGAAMAARTNATTASFEAKRAARKVTFARSKEWRRAMESVIEMKNANCFSPAAASVPIQSAAAQLAGGQALMYAGPSQVISLVNPLIKDRSQVSFVGAPMPGDKAGRTNVVIAPYNALSISASTKLKTAALAFVDFMARPRQGALFAQRSGNVATYDAARGVLPAYMKPLAPYFKKNQLHLSPGVVWSNPTVFGTFGSDIVGLLTGQKTVGDVLADIDRAYDAL